jgi:SAM-dependent methyltransferase
MGSEYVTDVGYVRSYHADLAPAQLRLVAALNGLVPPPAERFAYAELGCAYGDTTVPLAASNPDARFLGVDLNAEHVAVADAAARDGGVGNVRFVQQDFEELDARDLDFVTANGVLSWIAPDKRLALARLAADRLRPGGLLYVSYNALPGWAAVEPLRQLLLKGAGTEGDSLERARKGLAFAKRLRDAGAEYFTDNPPACEMLETMEKVGLRYVVHEYLHAHWAPMYFAQVAWEMASAGLTYVGSLPLHANRQEAPAAFADAFEGVTDRVTFESLKDFAVNTYFRRDVFVKGKPVRSPGATTAYLDATSFVGLRTAFPESRAADVPPLVDAVLGVLAEGSATGASLLRRAELARHGDDAVRAALLRLVLDGHAVPVNGVTLAVELAPGERYDVPLGYNRAVLERRLTSEIPIVLAAPIAGSGVLVSAVDAMAIRCITETTAEQRDAWVRAQCASEDLRMTIHDRPVESAEEQAEVIAREIASFERERLPKLVELGVLEPRAS